MLTRLYNGYFLYRNSVKQCFVFTVGITGEPEPLTEKDLREASNAIDVFGEQLVNKFIVVLIDILLNLSKRNLLVVSFCIWNRQVFSLYKLN